MNKEDLEIDVSKYDIKDGQTVIVKVPVGHWEMMQVQEHCKNVVESFKEEFKRNDLSVNFFVFPVSPNGVSPSMEVMFPPIKGSTMTMNIPVGGMAAGEIPKYLKSMRDMTMIDWDDKYPGVFLQVFGIMEDGSKVELKTERRDNGHTGQSMGLNQSSLL